MKNIDSIKDKLRKLLNLSNDEGASAGEIDNAIGIATQLMARHNLTREDIDLSDEDPTKNVKLGQQFAVSLGSRLAYWEICLAHFVTGFIGFTDFYPDKVEGTLYRNGIALLNPDGNERKGTLMWFYGSDESAQQAVELYEELASIIQGVATVRYASWARAKGAAYAEGFTLGLLSKLEKAKAQLSLSDEKTHQLVLVDQSNQLAVVNKGKQWLKETTGATIITKKHKGAPANPDNAYAKGRGFRDGQSYNPSKPSGTRRLEA